MSNQHATSTTSTSPSTKSLSTVTDSPKTFINKMNATVDGIIASERNISMTHSTSNAATPTVTELSVTTPPSRYASQADKTNLDLDAITKNDSEFNGDGNTTSEAAEQIGQTTESTPIVISILGAVGCAIVAAALVIWGNNRRSKLTTSFSFS